MLQEEDDVKANRVAADVSLNFTNITASVQKQELQTTPTLFDINTICAV